MTGNIRIHIGNNVTDALGRLDIDGVAHIEALGQTVNRADFVALAEKLGVSDAQFQIPDLRGRTLIGAGEGGDLTPRTLLDAGGAESVTLQPSEMPAHTHALMCDDRDHFGSQQKPGGRYLGAIPNNRSTGVPLGSIYSDDGNGAAMAAGSIAATGGNGSHENMMPWCAVRFFIEC